MRILILILGLCCIAAEFPEKRNNGVIPRAPKGVGEEARGSALPRLPNGDVDWNGPAPKVKVFGPKLKYRCIKCDRVTSHEMMWDHRCPFCKVMLVREVGVVESCFDLVQDYLKICWEWVKNFKLKI